MQHFRQHTLVSLLSLLVLAGLATPSLHTIAHVNRNEGAGHQAADAQPAAPHVEEYCATCDLAGTLHATTSEAVELGIVAYHTSVATLPPATVVAAPTIHFASRAPPASLPLIVHA